MISPDYIRKCLPGEYKQKSKIRREVCNISIANNRKNIAEQRTVAIDVSSTGQGTISEPESDPKEEIIKLRRIEEKDNQLEEMHSSAGVRCSYFSFFLVDPIFIIQLFNICHLLSFLL